MNSISNKIGNVAPENATMTLMAITILFQLLFIVLSIGIAFGIDMWGAFFTGTNIFVIIVFSLAFLYFNELLFTYKNKWKKINKEFESETDEKRKSRTLFVWLYFVTSFVMLVLSFWFITLNKSN